MDRVNLKRIALDDLQEIEKRLEEGMIGETIIYVKERTLAWHDVNMQSDYLLRAWFAGFCPACAAEGKSVKLHHNENVKAPGADAYCSRCSEVWSRNRVGRHLSFGRSNNKAIISFLLNEEKKLPKEILEEISKREKEGLNVS